MRRLSALTILALAIGLAPGLARAGFLYGVSGPGFAGGNQLLRIDTSTGQGTAIGPLATADGKVTDGVEDLTRGPDGTLYMITWKGSGTVGFVPRALYTVNPTSGQVALVGDPGPPWLFIESLAFVGNTLYGSADDDYDPIADHSKWLVTIDTSTGAVTRVGAFGADFQNVEAMATAPDGTLYGADIGTDSTPPSLIKIDPTTGAATRLALFPTDVLPAGLSFAPDGTLYASTIPARAIDIPNGITNLDSDLYTIDLNALSSDPNALAPMHKIGPIGFQLVDGITFVPEPGSLILTGLGGAGLGLIGLARSRRRSA